MSKRSQLFGVRGSNYSDLTNRPGPPKCGFLEGKWDPLFQGNPGCVMDPNFNLFGWRYFNVPVVCLTVASDHRPAIASRDRVIDMTRQRGW